MDVGAFYCCWAACLLVTWLLFSLIGGCDFHRRGLRAQVTTRPSWLPPAAAVRLQRPWVYLSLCHGLPWVLLVAGVAPHNRPLRLLAAVAASAYHIAETGATHSHRDYAGVYVSWAAAALPDDAMVQGVALGVCVHFIASSGYAKVLVAGATHWSSPRTLGAVMRRYSQLPGAEGPLLPRLSSVLLQNELLMMPLTVGTLVFECVVVPAVLFLGQRFGQLTVLCSIGLHGGIAAAQSFVIGVAFIPNLATYLYGFGADLPLFSAGWSCAVGVCAASAGAVAVRGQLLPEDWPLTPFALFAWNERQWNSLFEYFVDGTTRLVLAVDGAAPADIVGRRVLGKWGDSKGEMGAGGRGGGSSGGAVVYDAWEQCVGETLVYGPVLAALRDSRALQGPGALDSATLVVQVQRWLRAERRLVEAATGTALTRAYFVQIGGGSGGASPTVESVLAAA